MCRAQCSGRCVGDLDGFDPSDVLPEGADTLGGLYLDQPEPERAFDYPEPPERVVTFSELLEKCGYDEDVVEQYSDVGDTEVRLFLKTFV